jgi:hypothetical protein
VGQITARKKVFDARLLAGTPPRFERVTNRIHIRSRRRRTGLFASGSSYRLRLEAIVK